MGDDLETGVRGSKYSNVLSRMDSPPTRLASPINVKSMRPRQCKTQKETKQNKTKKNSSHSVGLWIHSIDKY